MLIILDATIRSRDGEGDGIKANTMEENGINIIENEWINRLIHDTFVAMDENTPLDEIYEDIHDAPLLIRHKNLYTKTQRQVFSLLFCCWSI